MLIFLILSGVIGHMRHNKHSIMPGGLTFRSHINLRSGPRRYVDTSFVFNTDLARRYISRLVRRKVPHENTFFLHCLFVQLPFLDILVEGSQIVWKSLARRAFWWNVEQILNQSTSCEVCFRNLWQLELRWTHWFAFAEFVFDVNGFFSTFEKADSAIV